MKTQKLNQVNLDKRFENELTGEIKVWYHEGSDTDLQIKKAWNKTPLRLGDKTLNMTNDWTIYCMYGRSERTKVCYSKKLDSLREMSTGEFFKNNNSNNLNNRVWKF